MIKWLTNHRTKKRFVVGETTDPSAELHPYVARPSKFEPILTTGQKLTPAQKQHLQEAAGWTTEQLYHHIQTEHPGFQMEELIHRSTIDPEVAKRFGMPVDIQVPRERLVDEHVYAHLADIEERVRTAPKRGALTPEEYKEAGVDVAPGFKEDE